MFLAVLCRAPASERVLAQLTGSILAAADLDEALDVGDFLRHFVDGKIDSYRAQTDSELLVPTLCAESSLAGLRG